MKNISPKPASDKSFGFLMSFILLIVSIYFFYVNSSYFVFSLGLMVIAFSISLTIPKLFYPFNFLWFRIGIFLSRVINPLVLGVMYFVFITPLAIILRLFGRDELRLRNKKNSSKWIVRVEQKIDPQSFKNQY